jgi:Bacterial regulatory proteins, luxR family
MRMAGSALGLTTRTVAFHKYRIMERLGARSGANLVKFAVRNCLHEDVNVAPDADSEIRKDTLIPGF